MVEESPSSFTRKSSRVRCETNKFTPGTRLRDQRRRRVRVQTCDEENAMVSQQTRKKGSIGPPLSPSKRNGKSVANIIKDVVAPLGIPLPYVVQRNKAFTREISQCGPKRQTEIAKVPKLISDRVIEHLATTPEEQNSIKQTMADMTLKELGHQARLDNGKIVDGLLETAHKALSTNSDNKKREARGALASLVPGGSLKDVRAAMKDHAERTGKSSTPSLSKRQYSHACRTQQVYGSGMPPPPKRKKIVGMTHADQKLAAFLKILTDSTHYTCSAFEVAILSLENGDIMQVGRGNIDASKRTLVSEYLEAVGNAVHDEVPGEDSSSAPSIPQSEQCETRSQFKQQCRLRKGHTGKHCYKNRGTLCARIAMRLMDVVCHRALTQRCGLDGKMTQYGYYNFKELRGLVKELAILAQQLSFVPPSESDMQYHVPDGLLQPAPLSREWKSWVAETITKTNDLYSYIREKMPRDMRIAHRDPMLCLTWKLSMPGYPCFQGKCTHDHDQSSPETRSIFTIPRAIINLAGNVVTVVSKFEAAELAASNDSESARLATMMKNDAVNIEALLLEARQKILLLVGHIAQCKNDALREEMALDDLKQGEVVEVQDYKMKLLQAFFREDTSKWFGKAGISCHGVMWRFLTQESESEEVG